MTLSTPVMLNLFQHPTGQVYDLLSRRLSEWDADPLTSGQHDLNFNYVIARYEAIANCTGRISIAALLPRDCFVPYNDVIVNS